MISQLKQGSVAMSDFLKAMLDGTPWVAKYHSISDAPNYGPGQQCFGNNPEIKTPGKWTGSNANGSPDHGHINPTTASTVAPMAGSGIRVSRSTW